MLFILFFKIILPLLVPESPFINPKFPKHVKMHVEDKDRRDQILDLVKEFKPQSKAFLKNRKEFIKTLKKSSTNRSVTRADLQAILDNGFKVNNEFQTANIDNRLRIQELLLVEEWENILAEIDSKAKKKGKKDSKILTELNKSFESVKKVVNKKIPDQDRKENITNSIENFENELTSLVEDESSNDFSSQIMNNVRATHAELQSVMDNRNEVRRKLYESYIQLHESLVANVKPEEWKKVIKEVNKIF